MKHCVAIVLLLASLQVSSQKIENIIIVTTDGFRWQEVFNGMDSAIANNKRFSEGDSTYIYEHYWSPDVQERRKKLLPFIWNTIAVQGQLYGNRLLGSEVNNANPYWFSYPGYSEIMTGHVDTAINTNSYPPNPHVTLLEYLNQQSKLKGHVAAFGAWNAFDRILNEQRSGLNVVSAFDKSGGNKPDASQQLINQMLQDSYKPWGNGECFDVFTHYAALHELKVKKPRVLFIGYGETDEWAHAGKYRSYLDAAHQVDAWLQQLWDAVQSDPQYKNKTAIFVTTDHGRGDKTKSKWTDHGQSVEDAYQIWFGVMAPGIPAKGEVKEKGIYYQKQFAQTMAKMMGYNYKPQHEVAKEIEAVWK